MQSALFCKVNPLQRPRVSFKGNIYTPTDNQQELFREIRDLIHVPTIDQPIILDTYINFKRPKNRRVHFPIITRYYGDEDNLRKAICDALQRLQVIKDDKLIIGGENYKLFDDDDWLFFIIYEANKAKLHE